LLTDAPTDRSLDHTLLRPRRPARGGHGSRARRRWAQLALVFVAAALIVNALIGDRGLVAAVRARHEHDQLAASIAGLKRDNQRLADAIRRLKHDPKAVEDVARQDLCLIRPGEVVFVIKDAPAAQPSPAAAR
jgi:cell division protein FtsB